METVEYWLWCWWEQQFFQLKFRDLVPGGLYKMSGSTPYRRASGFFQDEENIREYTNIREFRQPTIPA